MHEVEVKIIDVDVNEIKQKILTHNAILTKKEEQDNYFFDLPDKTVEGYIRIRKSKNLLEGSNKTIITIKKIISKDEVRITNETEIEIKSVDEGLKFLQELGLKQNKVAYKYRESYLLQNVLIEFDKWNNEEYPDPYIELEGDKDAIYNLIKLLEIDSSKITSQTLDEIKRNKGYL